MDCQVTNTSLPSMKFGSEIPWYVLFLMKLVELNLKLTSFIYNYFTENACLKLVSELVKPLTLTTYNSESTVN
jgi:hypothetical protein